MKEIFSYDNPVMHFIGKFWDVLVLNILWLICSIPIFTIGQYDGGILCNAEAGPG